MFESSRKGFGIKKIIPLRSLMFLNNMCGRPVKTSIFLILSLVLNLLTFSLTSNVTFSQAINVAKVAILGDSLTQGYGLLPSDNLVSQLQDRIIDNNYPVELLNLGVSGDTTAGGLARFEWSISSEVSGVIIILGGNDLLRGISPDLSYENLKNMITIAKENGVPVLLVGMTASTNFGSIFKKEFDQIYSRLQTEFDLFYYANFFAALNQENIQLFLSLMQNDGIHPNKDGVKKIVDDFYPTFQEFLDHILSRS